MQRFAADRMLGKLAKWMRVLGFDVVYLRQGGDEEIFPCLKEGRTILTRNRRARYWQQQGKVFVVSANDPKKQLREVCEDNDLPDVEVVGLHDLLLQVIDFSAFTVPAVTDAAGTEQQPVREGAAS